LKRETGSDGWSPFNGKNVAARYLPPFSTALGMDRRKKGLALSQRAFSLNFPQGATEPVPVSQLTCLQFELHSKSENIF
jgi:hypothetical protein